MTTAPLPDVLTRCVIKSSVPMRPTRVDSTGEVGQAERRRPAQPRARTGSMRRVGTPSLTRQSRPATLADSGQQPPNVLGNRHWLPLVNPYEPTINASQAIVVNPVRQRSIAGVFLAAGICSWVALWYAIKDIRILAEPDYQQVIPYSGFWGCAVFAWLCAGIGIYGIATAIRGRWHPWKVAIAYILLGAGLCYAGALVTIGYLMEWDR